MDTEKESTASFFVDCQKGFTILCPLELPVPGGETIAPELMKLWDQASVHVASGDEHPKNALFFADQNHPPGSSFPKDTLNMDVRWPSHCVIGTPGADLIPGIPDKAAYDLYVPKGSQINRHPYGACYYDYDERESTGVIEFLRQHRIQSVLVGGLATEFCVKTTALQLVNAGFHVFLYLDACRGIDAPNIERAIHEMANQSVRIIRDSEEVA